MPFITDVPNRSPYATLRIGAKMRVKQPSVDWCKRFAGQEGRLVDIGQTDITERGVGFWLEFESGERALFDPSEVRPI